MNTSLVIQHSLWWILPIVIISLVLVFFQYYRKKSNQNLANWQIHLLASIRFLVYFFLLFLLIGPRVKHTKQIKHKPVLLFAQDNSVSLKYAKDSSYYLSQYPQEIDNLISDLSEVYDVRKFCFGKNVEDKFELNYKSLVTDFSKLFEYLTDNYDYSDNIQMILASDGLYNTGSNPRYLSQKVHFPIHTLQLGDTSTYSDVSVSSVKSNRIGFLKQKLPVKVGIKANNAKNKKLKLEVKNGNKLLIQDDILVKNNSFYLEKNYFLTPEKEGLQKYSISVKSDFKEYSKKNNDDVFVVDVLNAKRKVSICYDQVHPDIAALRDAIQQNSNFECELLDLSKDKVDLNNSNLLVMYQIPSKKNAYASLFKRIRQMKIPVFMVLGGQSDLKSVNKLDMGCEIIQKKDLYQNAVYKANEQFALFDNNGLSNKILEKLPPVMVPFADVNFTSENQILAYQNIKDIDTNVPLIAFNTKNEQNFAWIFGEGIWRWKLREFLTYDSNSSFTELINRMIQYLALNEKRNQLIIKHKKDFIEGEALHFEAELYNNSFQLINEADLQFVLTDDKGKTYNYQFERMDNHYVLDVNNLQKGKYLFVVSTIGLKENSSKKGEFIVRSENLEAKNLQANPMILKQISGNTKGKYYKLSDVNRLKKDLLFNTKVKSTITYETDYGNALDLLYLLILIIILMILEWFLIKFWLGK